MRNVVAVSAAVAFAALSACAGRPAPEYGRELPEGRMALRKIVDPSRIPDFSSGFGGRHETIHAIDQSLAYLAKPSARRWYPYLDISHERVVASLKELRELLASARSGAELHRRIVDRFDVYESVGWNDEGEVLFTAYCEPIYRGSLVRTDEFRYPLYRLPPDLVKTADGVPLGRRLENGEISTYPSRRQIEEGDLLRGLELVWLADPVEAYIVHVQGSVRIRLTDGREMRIGYAGKTDRPYRSVAMEMVKDGRFPRSELSLQKVKGYFHRHPDMIRPYLHRNECYVFFTERDGGPYGSLNVPLTPGRSIATDKAVFPRAAMAYVVSEPMRGFALDQDTGGAIRSAGRCDLFLGSGPEAESRAGRLHHVGRLYYVFAKSGR
jgi:membrane-bound lytic murein transglycosylase A